MDANIRKANELKLKTVIKNLEKRNMTGYYCESAEEAAAQVLALIPEGSEVSWGGSLTLDQIGVRDMVKAGNYVVNDPMNYPTPAQSIEARRKSLLADVFLTSANAVTMDGEIVNIDGIGNRVAAIIFGPKKVIMVVGVNKLVNTEADAVDRIRCDACPPNVVRLGRKTPCGVTGKCAECLIQGETICCQTNVTRFSGINDRIHVILVNEVLGY